MWAAESYDTNAMFSTMIDALFGKNMSGDNVPLIGDTNEEFAMQFVLLQYLESLAVSTRPITPSTSTLLNALPPLPSVKFGSAASLYGGAQRPAVVVASSGYGVVVHVDDSGADALWEATISSTPTSVSVSSAQSSSYQGGQDPALSLYGDTTVVEVHGGNGNNSLYYNLITLSGSSVTIPDNGQKYDKGENPALAIAGSRAYEFHRDQNSSSDKLYYEVGTISTNSVDFPGSGTQYAEGDDPFACLCPGYWNLVVAHVRNSTITR